MDFINTILKNRAQNYNKNKTGMLSTFIKKGTAIATPLMFLLLLSSINTSSVLARDGGMPMDKIAKLEFMKDVKDTVKEYVNGEFTQNIEKEWNICYNP